MKTGITVIAIIFVATCCGTPATNTDTTKSAEKRNSPTDKIQKAEPNITTARKNILDAVYSNKILSYKNSINDKVTTLKKINKEIEGPTENGEATTEI